MYSSVPTICAELGEQRLLGQPLVDRLGHAEVDHLGHRLAVVQRHQHVRRLDVAVNDPLLMGVLDRLADRDEQLEPFAGRELVAVAVLGDRDALDQLHDEVGPAGVGRAGVEDLGDVGVVHQRQGLPLGLEAGDHLVGVHARLDDLEGDLAADGLLLLGHEDDAHAAFADLLQQLVGADERAGDQSERAVRRPIVRAGAGRLGRDITGGIGLLVRGRRLQERPTSSWSRSRRSTWAAQGRVVAARPVQVGRPLWAGRPIEGLAEDGLEVLRLHHFLRKLGALSSNPPFWAAVRQMTAKISASVLKLRLARLARRADRRARSGRRSSPALGGAAADPQGERGLLDGKTREEAKFDQRGSLGVDSREPGKHRSRSIKSSPGRRRPAPRSSQAPDACGHRPA